MQKIFENFRKALFEQHWGKIAGGVLIVAQDTKKILVALRSPYVYEPNTWGTVGGAITGAPGESDEEEHTLDIEGGVKNELYEETSYNGPLKLHLAYVYTESNFKNYNFFGIVPK